MSKRKSLARYSLIIKKLRKFHATFEEIADYLAFESELQEYDFNVSKRTFQRDLNDIRSLYNIDIVYDPFKKAYKIDHDQSHAHERILEAFDTFNALNISDRLSRHIHFEKRRPQGTENLYGLLHAIKNNLQISFTYQKFWKDEPEIRSVKPYALKEFKNRWYLLANNLKDNKVKTFALDRLTALEITKSKFQLPSNFNVDDYFKYCFGIITPNHQKAEEVILSFEPFQGKYIKTLPLHESQTILKDNDEELLVKLNLFITHDFMMELLSLGANVKVIQPIVLTEEIKSNFQKALKRYE